MIVTFVTYLNWKAEKTSAEIEQRQLARRNEAEAKRKAMTPAEHLANIQTLYQKLKTAGYTTTNGAAIKGSLSCIPKEAPEYAKGAAIMKQAEELKRAAESKVAARLAAEMKQQMATWRKQGVQIGMTAERVRFSSWGRPNKINRSQYADQVEQEQWVYSGGYLYFRDGILTGIQN
jgi:hypothetical protein